MDYKISFSSQPRIRRKCVQCSLEWITFFIVLLCVLDSCHCIYRDCSSNGESLACFPSTEIILINADTNITVEPPDATCGINGNVDSYLRLGDMTHTVYTCENDEHSKYKMIDNEKLSTWWQSKTWTVAQYQANPSDPSFKIDLTLSIKKKYRMSSDMTITFNSGRPQKMIISKSADNGATWQDLQYYARECLQKYPNTPTTYETNLTAVICTEAYSSDTSNPQQGLQAVFPGASQRMQHLDLEQYYTEMEDKAMRDFLTFTDIRIRLLYPATDSKEAINDPVDFFRYYYAISNIDITGSCFCNLHSSGCISEAETKKTICDCSHNTDGVDCERCLPLYNNKPWKEGSYLPYPKGTANACEKCECYDHATSCTYNATYKEGVCNDCTHNTTGRKCDGCLEGFYPDLALSLNDTAICPPCNCEALGLLDVNDTSCVNDRSAPVVGQCTCKPQVTGRRCDGCVDGYYGLLDPASPGTCKDCGCNELGRKSIVCDQTTGQCECKDSIEGRTCDICKDGFFNFPTVASAECESCKCDPGGSVNITCDTFGLCTCIAHVTGAKCNQVEPSHYIPSVDDFVKQPTDGDCVIGGGAYVPSNPFDGEVFATCPKEASSVVFEGLNGQEQQIDISWPYYVGVRYTLLGSEPRSGNLHVQPNANTNIDFKLQESLCPVSFQIGQDIPLQFLPGISKSVSGGTTLTLDRRCVYTVELAIFKNENASDIVIDSVVFLPNLSNPDTGKSFRILSESSDPAALTALYGTCREKMMAMISRPDTISPGQCRDLLWSISAEIYKEGTSCDCNATGSTLTSCDTFGGQCQCKMGVGGRKCDACLPGFSGFSDSGCRQCNCMDTGSVNGACDIVTGQCECLPNVAPNGQVDRDGISDNRQCRACAAGFYGYDSGNGCTACSCSSDGAVSSQCGPDGQCPCKDTIGGLKCDQCADGFFQYSPTGCTSCGCHPEGSTTSVCDKNSGICSCRENVEGDKCDTCKPGFFNLAEYNPRGCQPCFCFSHGTLCSSADGFVAVNITETSPGSWNVSDGRRHAPDSFLGDHHNSYGLLLSWEMFMTGVEGNVTLIEMVVIKGDGSRLSYRHKSETFSGTNRFGVRLFPDNWNLDDENPPTPDKMYRVLASIEEISFAVEYNTRTPTLSAVAMETAQASADVGAGFVESCTCDPGNFFAGLSCEKCGGGRRRAEPSAADVRYGTCVSCDCNQKTDGDPECDELTGICLNCRNGTAGDDCGGCAANVIPAACDTCMVGFWGISANGCSECNCSEVGTTAGSICAKDSGQCPCKSHVTGRQCDTCEESYHDLSETGCVECQGCYTLVKEEADKLRVNLVNTSALIDQIQAADENAVLGPFIDRLNLVTANLNTLLQFLQTANDEEADVTNHITRYTNTITNLTNQLDAQNNTEVPTIQQTLAETDVNLQDAVGTRMQTETYIKTVHGLQGPLGQIASNMASIVASLQDIRANMSSVTTDSSDQVARILSTVQTIENFARSAVAQADADQEKFQNLFDTHQNTSRGISTLENIDLTLDTLSSSANTEIDRLHAKSNATYDTAVRLQSMRSEIGFPNYNFAQMNITLITHQNNLASVKAAVEANTAEVEDKAIIVNTAIADTDRQKMETNTIIQECEALEGRLVVAKRTVEDAKKLANDSFADAETMLDVMTNFNARALEVQQQANASLEYVNSVNEESQKVIVEAESISSSLVQAQQASSQGLNDAMLAKTVAEGKNADITGVYDQAIGLQQNTSFDLTDLEARSQVPASINTTLVQPTYNRCQQQQEEITSANSVIEAAASQVGQAETTVEFTIADAQRLLNDLNNLPEINMDRIEALQGIVPLLAPLFNEQELVSTINNLKNDLDSQTTKINELKQRKENLEREIASLKLAQQAIIAIP